MRPGRGWLLSLMVSIGFVTGPAIGPVGAHRVSAAGPAAPVQSVQLSSELQGSLSLVAGSEELAKIARQATVSVVHIENRYTTGRGGTVEETGSGVITMIPGSTDPVVVTNRHVVAGSQELTGITVQLDDGRFLHPTHMWQDKATDVAVLKLPPGVSVAPAPWGDSDRLEIGHIVLALGSPFGLSRSVTLGIVSAKGRRSLQLGNTGEMLNQDFIQTDAAINPGNSGGPLVDLHGRVIGINTAIASNSGGNEGIAFSVPSNLARRVAEALVKYGKVPRAYLGVKLDPEFTAETARRFKLDRVRGTRVLQVYEKTPAARASLQLDDVILEFNGVVVQDENHLINMVSLAPIGKTIRLNVLRSGQTVTVEVLLADRTELDGAATQQPQVPAQSLRYKPTGLRTESTGPRLHPLDPSLAHQIGLGANVTGLVVLDPPQHGPLAGQLRAYDVLTEAGRRPIRSATDWETTSQAHAGQPLLVKVLRREGDALREFLIVWPAE